MANKLKKNLDAIIAKNKYLEKLPEMLENLENDQDAVIKEKGILYFRHENTYLRLHSQEMIEEAERMMKPVQERTDHLVLVFGITNTVFLRKLIENTTEGTRIALYEPNLHVLKYVLIHEDITDIIKCPKLATMFGDDEMVGTTCLGYLSQGWENMAQNILVISNPNYYVYAKKRHEYLKDFTGGISDYLKNLGTSLEDMLDGLTNYTRNVDAAMKTNDLEELRNKYKGYPAFIVASGPSLKKNIEYLKGAQDKSLIIACDASYRACVQYDIKPDMIASIERYKPTYDSFYEGIDFPEDLTLVAPALLWPDIYDSIPGHQILLAKTSDGVDKWWSKHFDKMGFEPMGSSCANVAYAAAVVAGCEPIVLVGQDLAYTDDLIHADISHYEDFENKVPEPSTEDTWVESVDGGLIKSNIYYEMFRMYFEKRILIEKIHTIDATEGGAKIKGAELMPLKEVIEKYCTKEVPYKLPDFLENIEVDDEFKVEKYKEIIEDCYKMIDELEIVKDKASDHFDSIKKYKDFDFSEATEQELYDIVCLNTVEMI
ncbi:MAG: DUF115 domain-containing protein [Lachnospiraceae bacterium]|nr:DUF115 domain-containing protein [Lachnospiraceae bacterium]